MTVPILSDTAVWITHFRTPLADMDALIAARNVVMHPSVIGELAVGNLPNRAWLLASLSRLPQMRELSSADVLAFIETQRLYGRGLGWVDVQLLAAVAATGHQLWTFDTRLRDAAATLSLAWAP